MSSYYELLKHPLWQKKRLEIMERDRFACIECGAKDQTLTVHHKHYKKGCKPWEYDDTILVTLCDSCHEQIENGLAALRRSAGELDIRNLEKVVGYCRKIAFDRGDSKKEEEASAYFRVKQKIPEWEKKIWEEHAKNMTNKEKSEVEAFEENKRIQDEYDSEMKDIRHRCLEAEDFQSAINLLKELGGIKEKYKRAYPRFEPRPHRCRD